MPGHSFSLPAGDSCPASKLTLKKYGENATCHMCYAKLGNYRFPNVKDAQQARFDFVLESIAEDGGSRFVSVMIEEISRVTKRQADKVFRIHDSGDFFSPAYVECWIRIVQALPDVRFWAPTREHLREMMLEPLRRLAALPNMALRPSAPVNNTPAPVVEGLQAGSAVYSRTEDVPNSHHICPATNSDDHTCDGHGCRACWSAKDTPVVYVAHGQKAKRALKVLQALE